MGIQSRGGAVWQLVGLITRRSQVQILSPQPTNQGPAFTRALSFGARATGGLPFWSASAVSIACQVGSRDRRMSAISGTVPWALSLPISFPRTHDGAVGKWGI